MALRMDQVLINRYYQTTAGEVRHVTAIIPEQGVTFTSYDVQGKQDAVSDRNLPLKAFADEIDGEVSSPT